VLKEMVNGTWKFYKTSQNKFKITAYEIKEFVPCMPLELNGPFRLSTNIRSHYTRMNELLTRNNNDDLDTTYGLEEMDGDEVVLSEKYANAVVEFISAGDSAQYHCKFYTTFTVFQNGRPELLTEWLDECVVDKMQHGSDAIDAFADRENLL
jgi:hypothetical protein